MKMTITTKTTTTTTMSFIKYMRKISIQTRKIKLCISNAIVRDVKGLLIHTNTRALASQLLCIYQIYCLKIGTKNRKSILHQDQNWILREKKNILTHFSCYSFLFAYEFYTHVGCVNIHTRWCFVENLIPFWMCMIAMILYGYLKTVETTLPHSSMPHVSNRTGSRTNTPIHTHTILCVVKPSEILGIIYVNIFIENARMSSRLVCMCVWSFCPFLLPIDNEK